MSSSTHRSSLKTLAGLGLLCSIQMADVAQAIKTSSTSTAKLDAQIESLSAAVQKELAQTGELAGLMSESELASLVNSEVRAQVASEQKQTQKTNLEAKTSGVKKHAVSTVSWLQRFFLLLAIFTGGTCIFAIFL